MADGRDHQPNQTVSGSDEQIPALPRDPNQSIHKKPRVFLHRPNEDPSGQAASIVDAAKSIQLSDFGTVHQTPCFRQAMLPSISTGVGVGALRFVMGGSVFSALNFTSGAFVAVSVVMYNRCQAQRRQAKDNVRRAAAVLDEKEAIKVKGQQKGDLPASGPGGGGNRSGVGFWASFKFW